MNSNECKACTNRHSINDTVHVPISVRIPDAVKLTGMTRSRIYELIKAGDIDTIKVGASTLILFRSLQEFLLNRRGGH